MHNLIRDSFQISSSKKIHRLTSPEFLTPNNFHLAPRLSEGCSESIQLPKNVKIQMSKQRELIYYENFLSLYYTSHKMPLPKRLWTSNQPRPLRRKESLNRSRYLVTWLNNDQLLWFLVGKDTSKARWSTSDWNRSLKTMKFVSM